MILNNKPYNGNRLLNIQLNLPHKQNMILNNKPYNGAKLLNYNLVDKYYLNIYLKPNSQKLYSKNIQYNNAEADNHMVNQIISDKYEKNGTNFYATAKPNTYQIVPAMVVCYLFSLLVFYNPIFFLIGTIFIFIAVLIYGIHLST